MTLLHLPLSGRNLPLCHPLFIALSACIFAFLSSKFLMGICACVHAHCYGTEGANFQIEFSSYVRLSWHNRLAPYNLFSS